MKLTPFRPALLSMPLAAAISACAGGASVQVRETSVCELATWGAQDDGKRVRLRAVFDTDGIENSVLRDESCPGVVLAPRDPPDEKRDVVSSRAFDDAVHKPGLHRIRIDVSGVFRWRQGKRPPHALEMEKFWRIEELPK